MSEPGPRPSSRPRILLKAPTLAEMEEMNIFEVGLGRNVNAHVMKSGERFLWNYCCRLGGLTGAFHGGACFVPRLNCVKIPLCMKQCLE